MKEVWLAVAALSLSGCSSPEDRAHDRLLDSIEQSIRLPTGAKPLDSYVRYYAPGTPGEIVGTFILPGLDELPPGEDCEQLHEDMTSEPCTFAWPKSADVGAGSRVWLHSYEKLPLFVRDDEYCGRILVIYRTSDRQFLDVICGENLPADI